MTKKELRKELELTLVKTIEEVLSKKNPDNAKKLRKTTQEASKVVAKKFYKSLKEKAVVKTKNKPALKTKKKPALKTKVSTPVKKAKIKK